jgi:uncharacterized protein YjbI with pentapeptide repeats
MLLVNDTPFSFAPMHGKVRWPADTATLIVKGSFRLEHGRAATPLPEQDPVSGDVFAGDDLDGVLVYPNDFAPFKPRADVLLVGKARPRRPASSCEVELRVGGTSSRLRVTGDRYWLDPDAGIASKPLVFAELDLGYDRAFGGGGFPSNPRGRGVFGAGATDPQHRPLPNVEAPDSPVAGVHSRPPPAGFGPLSPRWAYRLSKAGTYDGRWLAERWPWQPADFDWAYHNAAQPLLQVDGYLRGDEEIRATNLHARQPDFRAALPGLRPRCFLRELAGGARGFREVPLLLDTLWIDMEADKLVLVWRGVAEARSEKLREIEHVLLVCEPLAEAAAPAEHYRAELETRLLAGAPPEAVAPVAAANDNEPPPVDEGAVLAHVRDVMQKVKAPKAILDVLESGKPLDDVLDHFMRQAGADPARPDELVERVRLQTRELLVKTGHDPSILDGVAPPPPPPWTRERVTLCAGTGEPMAGQDLRGLDLSELDLTGAVFRDALLAGAVLRGAKLYGADLSGALLAGADLRDGVLGAAKLVRADLTGARAEQADFSNAVLTEAVLEGCALDAARFDDADCTGASFRGAVLTRAKLARAALARSHFDGASLDEAELRGARLDDASFQGARGLDVDFYEANMAGVRAGEGCRLVGAKLGRVRGDGSTWIGADLTRADLSLASFRRAAFAEAQLEAARLYGADMKDADFTEANLREVDARHANLWGARLESADLERGDFREANLYEAELWRARRKGARFEGAHVARTKLEEPGQ